MRFVWIDLEMTGLDPERCAIIEMGLIITGPDLTPIAQLERVIWQPDDVLARIEPFVRTMHTRNGLLEKVRLSTHGQGDVEREALALVAAHCGFREGILAGNSIHQDRRFLARHMPQLEGFLHYRQVDVSSLKVLAKAWYGPEVEFKKEGKNHTALEDIQASLDELRHYREKLLRLPPCGLSARRDGDLAGLERLGLGQPELEHTARQPGLDLVGVDAPRHREGAPVNQLSVVARQQRAVGLRPA